MGSRILDGIMFVPLILLVMLGIYHTADMLAPTKYFLARAMGTLQLQYRNLRHALVRVCVQIYIGMQARTMVFWVR